MTRRIHLDTDLGGDIDDLCALALLLRWPEPVEVTGITVVGDTNGVRTGMVRQALRIAGREDIPVAAGADTSGGYYPYELTLPDAARYWPEPVVPSPNPPEEALDLLQRSIESGATLVAIGPLTNLRLLEERRPGILAGADYVQMGGYLAPPPAGYPQWPNSYDFNVQVDAQSAKFVFERSSPLLVPISVTAQTSLRRTQLSALDAGDALARLVARQARAYDAENHSAERYAEFAAVPRDHVNFQHDGLAVAIALGWGEAVVVDEVAVRHAMVDAELVTTLDPKGRTCRLVTAVDGAAFDALWLQTVAGG